MRKHIIASTEPSHSRKVEEWLNLVEAASVEVSSEDPQHPIESAFKDGETLGWRADESGAQKIRLLFDEPKDLRRIWLRFSEPEVERTQQFTLSWADSQTAPFREIVRQQWNFNPRTSAEEIEDSTVALSHLLSLELALHPHLLKGQAYAAFEE